MFIPLNLCPRGIHDYIIIAVTDTESDELAHLQLKETRFSGRISYCYVGTAPGGLLFPGVSWSTAEAAVLLGFL